MPERFFKILREPGEALTLVFALFSSVASGSLLNAVTQPSQWSLVISAAGGVLTVLIVYFFRDRMKQREVGATIHKSDIEASTHAQTLLKAERESLLTAQNNLIAEQRASFLAIIAEQRATYDRELKMERDLKHEHIQLGNDVILSYSMIFDRIRGVESATRLALIEGLRTPEHYTERARRIPVVPREIE